VRSAPLFDALAVFRLTKLVVDDEIFADVRDKLLDRFPPESTKLGYLITCPWCVSIYLGGAAVAARALLPRQWDLLARALSYSALTGLVAEKV
jgi:hypothetical protein